MRPMRHQVILWLLLLWSPTLAWAMGGNMRIIGSSQVQVWTDQTGIPDCATNPDLQWWSVVEAGTVGSWTICGVLDAQTMADLQAICGNGLTCGFTNLPPTRPLLIAPSGEEGVQTLTYGLGGDYIEECVNNPGGPQCHPRHVLIYPDRTFCIDAVLQDPPSIVALECISNVGVAGIGTTITRTDRGLYANRPTAPYVGQTYIVIDCNNGTTCTTGGGTAYTFIAVKMWTGSVWKNLSISP